jgi:hypothetical protein
MLYTTYSTQLMLNYFCVGPLMVEPIPLMHYYQALQLPS